jgi:hypothetical protein
MAEIFGSLTLFDLIVRTLWMVAIWALLAWLFVTGVIALCLLFGSNAKPPAVPNKAVWG